MSLFPPAVLSIAEIHEAIAATRPDEECLIFREKRFTWNDITLRTRQLANYLASQGLGCTTERDSLLNWDSGQDHLAIYLYNGNEYLEAMLGSWKARVAPFNVNYRYVEAELEYLIDNSDSKAVFFDAALAAGDFAARRFRRGFRSVRLRGFGFGFR